MSKEGLHSPLLKHGVRIKYLMNYIKPQMIDEDISNRESEVKRPARVASRMLVVAFLNALREDNLYLQASLVDVGYGSNP